MEDEKQITTIDLTIYPPGADGELRQMVVFSGQNTAANMLVSAHQDETGVAHVSITAGNIPVDDKDNAKSALVEFIAWILEVVMDSTEVL